MHARFTLVALLALAAACRSKPAEPVRVAAAADLTVAFNALNKNGTTRLTFGSTGILEKQLIEGAPFDVFAAADVESVDRLIAKGICLAETKTIFARGRLVVWSAPGITAPGSLEELADERFKKIAIANTEHAPYGRAAQAALEAAGVYGNVKQRLVFADNVSHALSLVRTGNAQAGLVARSLVTELQDGEAMLVDAALHSPLNQAAVVCAKGDRVEAAKAFIATLSANHELLTKYGFE